MFTEPHSTKQSRTASGWGLETDPRTLIDVTRGLAPPGDFRDSCERVRCPVLVIHGDEDAVRPHAAGAALADVTGGEFVTLEGSGHGPHARNPLKVNLLLRDFVDPPRPKASVWTRGCATERCSWATARTLWRSPSAPSCR